MSSAAAPAPITPLLQLDRVTCRHGSFRLTLNDVSCSIARGQFVLLRGGHGAGKTTLLSLAAGLQPASSGSVRVAGEDLSRLKPRALARLRQSIGIVPQDLLLLDDRSVLDNVLLPTQVAGISAAEGHARARAALARVALDPAEIGARRPGTLGGGERQRVAIARALVNRPALLLVDEPVAALDRAQATALIALLRSFAAAGVAVLLASRDERDLWPADVAPWSLADGRLVIPALADVSEVA